MAMAPPWLNPVFRGDANHERGDGLRHGPARKRKGGKANRARLVGVEELDGAPPSSSREPGSRFIFGGENDAWEMLRSVVFEGAGVEIYLWWRERRVGNAPVRRLRGGRGRDLSLVERTTRGKCSGPPDSGRAIWTTVEESRIFVKIISFVTSGTQCTRANDGSLSVARETMGTNGTRIGG